MQTAKSLWHEFTHLRCWWWFCVRANTLKTSASHARCRKLFDASELDWILEGYAAAQLQHELHPFVAEAPQGMMVDELWRTVVLEQARSNKNIPTSEVDLLLFHLGARTVCRELSKSLPWLCSQAFQEQRRSPKELVKPMCETKTDTG